MMLFLLICLGGGALAAVPLWVIWQHVGARSGIDAARRFDMRDTVECHIEAVALRAQLVRDTLRDAGAPR